LVNPEEFLCPITKEVMSQPVILVADGTTYEESALKVWLKEHNTSPLTGLELHTKEMKPNYNLRQAIENYLKYVNEHKEIKRAFEEQLKIAKSQKNGLVIPTETNHTSDNEDEDEHEDDNSTNPIKDKIPKSISEFLESIHLSKYLDILKKEGFQDMSDLSQVTFPDLIAMNIPTGHARRLLQQLLIIRTVQMNPMNNVINCNISPVILSPGKLPKSCNSSPLNVNVLLLGDVYVGKTALRKRMELDQFVSMAPTTGVELSCLLGNYQGESLQVTVWDPAGMERYAPIAKTFFRRAHGAAVVFAANDPSSWKAVEFWLSELDDNAPDDIEIILICNKIDILEDENNVTDEKHDMTTTSQTNGDENSSYELLQKAVEVARSRRLPLFLTSAKSGECVKQAFQELVSQILSNERLVQKLCCERDGFAMVQKNGAPSNPKHSKSDPPLDGKKKKKSMDHQDERRDQQKKSSRSSLKVSKDQNQEKNNKEDSFDEESWIKVTTIHLQDYEEPKPKRRKRSCKCTL